MLNNSRLDNSGKLETNDRDIYRLVFERSKEAIIIVDGSFNLLEVNRAGCDLLGYETFDPDVRKLSEIIHSKDHAACSFLETASAVKETAVYHARVIKKDKTAINVELCINRLSDNALMISIIDLKRFNSVTHFTNNNKIEDTLRASIDALPMWISCIDTEGKYFFANKYYTSTFKLPLENIEGHNFKEFFPPVLYEKHKRLVDECFETRQSVTFEDEADLGNNIKLCIYGVYTPLFAEDKTVCGLSAAAFDVTAKKELELRVEKTSADLKEHEEKLQEWASRYEYIVNASGQIAYDYNVMTGEILWGSAIEKVLGYSLEKINKGFAQWVELLHPEDRNETLRKLSVSEQNCSFFDAEYRLRHKDGHYVWLRDRGFFVADGSGKAFKQLGMIEDITDQKKANDALIYAKEQAEAANRAKSLFMANMSHEIRTPMNGIIGFTNLMGKSGLDAKQKEFNNIIKTSCMHLLGIIDDILDFSKIEARKLKFENSLFDVKTALNNSIKLISEQAGIKKLLIETSMDDRINYKVNGDELRFKQILINLLTNAIKFTPEGKVGVNISQLSVNDDISTLSIEVYDTGIGIPAEKTGEIFEMFHQLDESSNKRHSGSGIGLAIVKGLVEAMHGTVGVESEIGKGSRFSVVLPFKTDYKEN